MNLPQALEIVQDHIRIGKCMELTNGVSEALEIVVVALEFHTRENKRLQETIKELGDKNIAVLKALELAVESEASNFCVFNGIEKELWPDYCKDQPEPEHKTCVMCWRGYYLAKAGDAK